MHGLAPVQYRAMRAIEACRTERLGGHIERCESCGVLRFHFHSCRNRSCPKCQTLAKERWLEARRAELLPVPYFHLVFTLPHELNALVQGNARAIYALLFEAVSATLIEFGENPRWLGGQIAATLVLHTWGQTLTQHLHLHCLVAEYWYSFHHRELHWRCHLQRFACIECHQPDDQQGRYNRGPHAQSKHGHRFRAIDNVYRQRSGNCTWNGLAIRHSDV